MHMRCMRTQPSVMKHRKSLQQRPSHCTRAAQQTWLSHRRSQHGSAMKQVQKVVEGTPQPLCFSCYTFPTGLHARMPVAEESACR